MTAPPIEHELLSVAEAAALLRVAPSTVRRWVRSGALPGYRVGRQRVALRRDDVAGMVTPTRGGPEGRTGVAPGVAERRRRMHEAVEAARRLQQELLAARGGVPFSPSWELIGEARDERGRSVE